MSHRLVIRPPARRDIEAARDWYRNERRGLDRAFLDELTAAFQRIAEHPESYASASRARTRRAPLRRFPYLVYYHLAANGTVSILACLHAHRDPAVAGRRLR